MCSPEHVLEFREWMNASFRKDGSVSDDALFGTLYVRRMAKADTIWEALSGDDLSAVLHLAK
jgi:hypothetical protein